MAFLRQWLLIFSALILGGGPLWAASIREDRAFAAATAAFQDENWSRAETGFARFVQRFPKSERVPQVVLLEAQAQFKQGKYAAAGALLTFDDFLVGVENFGTRIQPLMKSRRHVVDLKAVA